MKNGNFETNSYYLGLVQNLFSGPNSCFVAFMQFFYQHLFSKKQFPQFEECFLRLQSSEIENAQLLGEILLEMGGDPQLFSASRKYVCAKSLNYAKDIDKIFLNDIELLEINIIDLKSAIMKIDDKNLKEKLFKILDNKKLSLKLLKEEFFKSKIVK